MTTLRGPRVTLRPWRNADLPPFAALNDDFDGLSGRKAAHRLNDLIHGLHGRAVDAADAIAGLQISHPCPLPCRSIISSKERMTCTRIK